MIQEDSHHLKHYANHPERDAVCQPSDLSQDRTENTMALPMPWLSRMDPKEEEEEPKKKEEKDAMNNEEHETGRTAYNSQEN